MSYQKCLKSNGDKNEEDFNEVTSELDTHPQVNYKIRTKHKERKGEYRTQRREQKKASRKYQHLTSK